MAERLIEVSIGLDEAWRDAVARRFDVVLDGWLGGAMFLFLKAVRWLVGSRPMGSFEPDNDSRTIKLRSGIRREEAETYLDEADPQRHDRPRTEKTAYRIVPANFVQSVAEHQPEA